MKKFVIGVLVACGILAILVVLLFGAGLLLVASGKKAVPDAVLLEASFEKAIPEAAPDDPFAALTQGEVMTVRDVVEALQVAAKDAKVKGLVVRVGEAPLGVARIQELRDAVIAFRKSGKPAIAWSETFGEFGPGNASYWLATAFDEIWLLPSGDVGLTGLIAEGQFLRGTFDKLGVVPRMDHRYEYKNAMNQLTEKKFTAPHKEALGKIVSSIFGQMVQGIAEGRKLGADEVRALADRGPFFGQEAVDAKLVDGLAYRDEAYQKARAKAHATATLGLRHYQERAGRAWESGTTVALIHGDGAIQRGKGGFSVLGGEAMGSDTVAAAFRDAIDDASVKAILFRVDSPGGSAVASDVIWRETVRAKRAGKPVVVSMGNVAGSGGYWVSMAADKIVAQPGTITGSIGVLAGKLLTNGMWDKVGLSFDEIHTSKNATIWSASHDYTPEEWSRFQSQLDRIYADFVRKVAEGRKLPVEKVKEIAKGRIWSGEDAKELGLVDALGGYVVALGEIRKLLKVPETAGLDIKEFPRPRTPVERILERMQKGDEETEAARAAVEALQAARPLIEAARAAGLLSEGGDVVRMRPVAVR